MLGLGHAIDSATMEKGLRELCPGIHFDMPNKISEAHFVLNAPDREAINLKRQGIYYNGRYICAMDRPISPEYKVWTEEEGVREISAADVDKHDFVHTVYFEILKTDPLYHEALYRAEIKDDNYTKDEHGRVFKWQHLIFDKVRGEIEMVGWRHTFENLIAAKLPGITRDSLAAKFGVDLSKSPEGPDAVAALTEE